MKVLEAEYQVVEDIEKAEPDCADECPLYAACVMQHVVRIEAASQDDLPREITAWGFPCKMSPPHGDCEDTSCRDAGSCQW